MPFVSSKENNHSMGLGLAICRDILTKVGGDICLTDTDKDNPKGSNEGAKFKITLLKVSDELKK
jgi:C4-dicarboxylate-specific signal transduction histidine kinase